MTEPYDVHAYLDDEARLVIEIPEGGQALMFEDLTDFQNWNAKVVEAAVLTAYGVQGGTA